MIDLIAIAGALLIYLILLSGLIALIRLRYPSWPSRRFVTGAVLAGPLLVALGLAARAFFPAENGLDGHLRTSEGLTSLFMTALAALAAIPAAAIGYILTRHALGAKD
ncbi:hypothetical protein ACSBM8_10575 [Sphingomonas sp. ASY06-1R]|uniref:hypothetical protein n=1 Tax=Sphingomonas sp. ASY06-1R TaxID=3445771 RepID=UPI003FA332FE